MRSDGLPRGQEEDNVEMVWGKARQAWSARGGDCWCRPPAPPRLASAPCTGCCQACQPSPSSLTSCATSSSTRATRHQPPGGSMYGRPPPGQNFKGGFATLISHLPQPTGYINNTTLQFIVYFWVPNKSAPLNKV